MPDKEAPVFSIEYKQDGIINIRIKPEWACVGDAFGQAVKIAGQMYLGNPGTNIYIYTD